MEWFWKNYTDPVAEKNNPYACPLRAKDLKNLPPALVLTASHDPLRDEGERFAERLIASGVKTTCTRYEGVTHGFVSFADGLDKGKDGQRRQRTRCAQPSRGNPRRSRNQFLGGSIRPARNCG